MKVIFLGKRAREEEYKIKAVGNLRCFQCGIVSGSMVKDDHGIPKGITLSKTGMGYICQKCKGE